MEDDEELEMLLGEIPHEISRNLHYPQRNGSHVSGHGRGSFVNQTMNGSMYGLYDDHDPSSQVKNTCASPVSGFSLISNGSSSSLLSGGYSLSDCGSPTPPSLEELKSQMPRGRCHHPDGYWLDFRVPDQALVKTGNETFIDELNLSRNFGRMRIRDKRDNLQLDPNGVRLFDHPISSTNPICSEKFGDSNSYRRGFPEYGGPQSHILGSPMCFDGVMSPELSGFQYCDNRLDDFVEFHYPSGRANGLFSEANCISSPSNFPYHSNYHQRGLSAQNLASSITQSSVADGFYYAKPNAKNFNEERGATNVLYMPEISHPWPRLGVGNLLHSKPPLLNGWTRAPSTVGTSHGAVEVCTREDSLIIQGEGLNYGMEKGSCHPRGRNFKGSLCDIGGAKPQGKRPELDGFPKFTGICQNGQSEWLYYSATALQNCNSLAESRGYIYLLAKNQNGCRLLQNMFNTPHDVEIIFNGIIDHVVELTINQFGNYLMQKLLEVCNEEQRMQILLMITEEPGQFVRISLNNHGTRVVQKLIETLKTRQQILVLISALKPGFLDLIKDLNGNHVVQRCLQCLSSEDNKFIFVAAAKHCVDIATHQHGCCVLQRCIRNSTGKYRDNLVTEISAKGLLLAQDAYGNFVVQLILELRIPAATSNLISQFEGNYVHLSTQKFSSHVVEKCLTLFDDEIRSEIIRELLSASHFEQLLLDPHANYVLQTALRVSEGSVHNRLVAAIESCKAISRSSPYSKRIFSHKLLKK